MATLSKHGSGSWRARGAVVRDARHTHNGPNEPAHRSNKDRKRWCRGKPGREHVMGVSLSLREWWPRLVRHCSACGKEFDVYSDRWGRRPAWVTDADKKALDHAKSVCGGRKLDLRHTIPTYTRPESSCPSPTTSPAR